MSVRLRTSLVVFKDKCDSILEVYRRLFRHLKQSVSISNERPYCSVVPLDIRHRKLPGNEMVYRSIVVDATVFWPMEVCILQVRLICAYMLSKCLLDAELDDQTRYTCSAQNTFGQQDKTTMLMVTGLGA